MGDTLVALPCLHSLRRWFPTAHITWLTNRPINIKARASADLLTGMGLVDEYLDYPVGMRDPRAVARLAQRLIAGRYDVVIDLAAGRGRAKTVRDAAFFGGCGLWNIVGLPWRQRDLQCAPDPKRPGLHEAEASRLARRLAVLGPVNLEDRTLWSLNLRPSELTEAKSLVAGAGIRGGYLVVSVGTKADVNDWSQTNWLDLLDRLGRARPDLGLVMLGASDEVERSDVCLQRWPGPKANLAGGLTVRQSAAVMRDAQLFIGHDSGPMHLAASVDLPCVAIFSGRNPPGQWFPAGVGHHVFLHRTECTGCGLRVCDTYGKKCILAIRPASVVEAVLSRTAARVGLT